jgi:plastocyanin
MRAAVLFASAIAFSCMASAASALAGETVQVKITDLAFSPMELTARVGDTVQWLNNDIVDHTATATKGADWDVVIVAGKQAEQQLTRAGEIDYFCRFHPFMKAKITVLAE